MRNIILIVEQEIVLFAILFNGNDETWIQSNNFSSGNGKKKLIKRCEPLMFVTEIFSQIKSGKFQTKFQHLSKRET